MKKKVLISIIAFSFIFSLILLLNIRVFKYDSDTYICWSSRSLNEKVENLASNKKIKVIPTDSGNAFEVPIEDLGIKYKFKNSSDEEIKKFPRFFNLNEFLSYEIDDEKVFRSYFSKMNKSLSKSKNAYYEVSDSGIVLHKEVVGTRFNINNLCKDFSSLTDISVIDLNDYKIYPSKDETYFEDVENQLGTLRSWGISYSNDFNIEFKDIVKYIKIKDISISLNKKGLKEHLSFLLSNGLSSYNTVGKKRDFTTTSGDIISLYSGTYGNLVDIDSEVNKIISYLDEMKSEKDREPILSLDMPNELPNTYIEVSIDKQHLWYYVNGVLKMEADVVTGTRGKTDTPKGIYYISERIGGKYLTGDNYKTWVNQWMRLTNSGVGLHDAYWRSSFGGNIYTYSGSHGCINLPKDFAKKLFDSVERKTAVIVY